MVMMVAPSEGNDSDPDVIFEGTDSPHQGQRT